MKNSFNDFIIEQKIVSLSETPFKLKSGKESCLYVNWRQASNDVYSLDKTADFVLDFVQKLHLNPHCFFGVPEGATKLGILCTYKLAKNTQHFGYHSHILPMGRGQVKEHGKPEDRIYIGMPQGQQTIVIEDVTTTGTSLIKCVDQLRENGVPVIAAMTLTNRQDNPNMLPDLFEKRYGGECPFYALTTIKNVLNRFEEVHPFSEKTRDLIKQEFSY